MAPTRLFPHALLLAAACADSTGDGSCLGGPCLVPGEDVLEDLAELDDGDCGSDVADESDVAPPPDAAPVETVEPPQCSSWECGDDYFSTCLANPVVNLTVAEKDYKKLLKDVNADVEVDGNVELHGISMPVGVELHGGTALKFEKKSYKLKFNRTEWFPLDPFADDPEENPDDPVGFKQLVLKAHWIDASLLRDRLAHELLRQMGGLAPRVVFVNLALNGRYDGVYALTEAIETDFFARLGMKGDGNLYKAVSHSANFGWKEDCMAGFEKKTNREENTEDLETLLSVLKATPASFEPFEEDVAPWLDLDLYLLFTVGNVLTNNQDSFTKNYYLYRDAPLPQLPFVIVNWDADATFGRSWEASPVPAEAGQLWGKANYLSSKLSAIPEYHAQYVELLKDALDTVFRYDRAHATLAAIAAEAAPDIRFEECRWSKERSFDDEIDFIDQFLLDRAAYLSALLEAP
jgi:spore coat protein H